MRIPGLILGSLALAASAVSYVYFNRPASLSNRQTTDDAYIQADFTNVASRISGVVTAVWVNENQHVKAGDILVTLDDRDLQVALQSAEAALAASEANLRTINSQIDQHTDLISQASAKVDADDAVVSLAVSKENRLKTLVTANISSAQSYEEAAAELARAIATRASDIAALSASRKQLDILNGQREGAQAAMKQSQARLEEARLQISYAKVVAPISGTVGRRSVRDGAFVSAGASLLSIVPLDQLYINASYRETQIARIRPGQAVKIRVDALPDATFSGTVESLGPASGSAYAAIASQNATGNFTKIAQRLPVRIHLNENQEGSDALRVGMSVVPEIIIE
ncbi:HlyD family secretion protein [Paenirhodobacter populi]|nr:HlyD family secretion protein [Sinirhodobacter populi]